MVRIVTYAYCDRTKLLGFNNLDEINARTGHPYLSLKILLSLYRRVKTLTDYIGKGKADFRNEK